MRRRDSAPAVLVALHGHGDDDATTRGWAERILPPLWGLEVPAAPGAAGERSWFDSTPRGVDPASLQASRLHLGRVVRDAADGAQVVVAGFSQGAAMALALHDEAVVAVVAFCPFLAEVDDMDLASGAPVLMLPAADDDVVPAFLGEDAAAAMSAAGRDVTLQTVGGTHEVGRDAASHARRWLEQLGLRAPSGG